MLRKIINDPTAFVDEVLEGVLAAHPDHLRRAAGSPRAIVRADAARPGTVAILTGGGSGHLPLFLGFIGAGLLDGAAVGNVFSSPSARDMLAATRETSRGAGVLYLYGNYGGDVYNFDLAADLARGEGIEVETVLGVDDLLSAPPEESHRRRGVAGLALIIKATGAAAARGWPLSEVARVARDAAARTRTIGVGLSPTILPAAGKPTFELADGEMEVGIGIHGERGVHRGPLEDADAITDRFLAALETELELTAGARVSVLVNGLGATPQEELYLIYRRTAQRLAEREVTIAHRYIGEYATSLEMAGASLSVCVLNDELAGLLDDPVDAALFAPWAPAPRQVGAVVPAPRDAVGPAPERAASDLARAVDAALETWKSSADELRDLDAAVGDGDLGLTVAAGADAAQEAIRRLPPDATRAQLLLEAAAAFATANPSTFAALVGTAGIAASTRSIASASWADALDAAIGAIAARGGAEPGDKTLLDPLWAALAVLRENGSAHNAADAAASETERTRETTAKRGRAAWAGERSRGVADPGAVAVTRLLQALAAHSTSAAPS